MGFLAVIWDLDDDLEGNVQHIAEQGLTKEEVDEILADPEDRGISRSSGLPVAYGTTSLGRYIAVVYQQVDADTVRPVTAYDLND
jgi:hypothetical protein